MNSDVVLSRFTTAVPSPHPVIAAALHRQGRDLAATTRTSLVLGPGLVLDPSLRGVTRKKVAAGLVLVSTLSRGTLAHAAGLLLAREGMGGRMSAVTLIAGLEAGLPRMDDLDPLPWTKTGAPENKKCVPAVPPLPREMTMKTD